jgi:outer membrane protein TolC
LRSADEQKLLIDDTVKAYTDALHLTQNCFEGGASPKSDVAQSLTQLDAAKVQDTDVTVARAQYEDAIAVLIGKPPAQFNLISRPIRLENRSHRGSRWRRKTCIQQGKQHS